MIGDGSDPLSVALAKDLPNVFSIPFVIRKIYASCTRIVDGIVARKYNYYKKTRTIFARGIELLLF